MIRLAIALSVLLCAIGCSGTEFGGGTPSLAGSSKSKDDKKKDSSTSSDNDADIDEDSDEQKKKKQDGDDSTDGDSDDKDDKDDEKVVTEDEKIVLRTECWFAVSGAYLGTTYYPSTFPKTKSGKPVAHNEIFDDVGGKFIAARAEPYIYQEGGKEIDAPVDWSFDSIAIAPGMRALIKDAAGNILFEKDGPAFRLSSDYGNHGAWVGALIDYKAKVAEYPEWMQKILKDTNFTPERTPLHAAKWLQVTKIPGERCDFND